MDDIQSLKRRYEVIAWGLLLILWGITMLFDFVSVGVGLVGSGLILLGLNAVRWRNGIPTKGSTTALGILALVWGGLELASTLIDPPFQLSGWMILGIVLIVWGGIRLLHELRRIQKPDIENVY
jgi:hypothetical protein